MGAKVGVWLWVHETYTLVLYYYLFLYYIFFHMNNCNTTFVHPCNLPLIIWLHLLPLCPSLPIILSQLFYVLFPLEVYADASVLGSWSQDLCCYLLWGLNGILLQICPLYLLPVPDCIFFVASVMIGRERFQLFVSLSPWFKCKVYDAGTWYFHHFISSSENHV